MSSLPSLPTELICQILSCLQPITELHKYGIPEEQRWDARHWSRAVAAVARTCRTLHAVATPLLYSHHEAALHNPVIAFIDHHTTDRPRHQGLTHVAIRSDGSTSKEYTFTPQRLSQYRIWARGNELGSYLPSETETVTSEDAAQIELWRLISQAPNLASLNVTSHKWLGRDVDQPPVWILPIVLATQSVGTNPRYQGWFEKLHTLKFSMNGQCGTWLVHILSLPCLETLRVGSWGIQPYADWEASLVWPEPTATSRVSDLSLWDVSVPTDVIVRVMDHCVALKSFSCDRAYDRDRRIDRHGRQWSIEVLAGLQHHCQTLTSLKLNPSGKISVMGFEPEYARVEGFQTLVALESLTVDWYVLMGSQAGRYNSDWNSGWEPVGDWTYPSMREVLPKNLRHLRIDKTRSSTPGCMGIEQALCAAAVRRVSNADENDVFLSAGVHFVYHHVHPHKPLPMNLWRVKDVFEKAGCRFEYKLRLDPLQFVMDSTEGVQSSIEEFGRTLADEGPAGVHMALRSDCPGLAGKVMELLGLQEEWLSTEEAKEVLFGDEVGAWALGSSKTSLSFD